MVYPLRLFFHGETNEKSLDFAVVLDQAKHGHSLKIQKASFKLR